MKQINSVNTQDRRMKRHVFDFMNEGGYQMTYFTPEDFVDFLLRIECDATDAPDVPYAHEDADGVNIPHFIFYKIPGGSIYKIVNRQEALTFFHKRIKASKSAFLKPRKQSPKKYPHIQRTDYDQSWREIPISSTRKYKGQVRFVPPKQEQLLLDSGRKKWPGNTYTGKIRKMGKRKNV